MESLNLTRRDVLKLAGALGLSFALPAIDARAAQERGSQRPKSLITLWMAGGPSQLETWDPHPGHINGGPTQAIDTAVPGLRIAQHFPLMAEQMQYLSVIRSLVSKEGDHERGAYYLKTGYRPDPTLVHPSLGAILTHELPADDSVKIPQHISLGPGQWASRGGFLGDNYDAFRIYDPGRHIQNLRAQLPADPNNRDQPDAVRQQRRTEKLKVLSRSFAQGRKFQLEKTLHQETVEKALAMMDSAQLKAFELTDEPAATLKAYGDSVFGRGCLVARRLIETGVRAVEVTLDGFDSHADNFTAHAARGPVLDAGFAALVSDLRRLELLDSTVVLCIGEFGRTNRINPLEGRDHWPSGFSCVVGGGGLKSGVLIGETNPAATNPKDLPQDPVEVFDLYATLFHTLGLDHRKEYSTPIGRPMTMSQGKPIERLLPG